MKNRIWITSVFLLTILGSGQAATNVWTGGAVNGNWTNAANWSLGVPASDQDLRFDNTSVLAGTVNSNFTVRSVTVASGYTNIITQNSNLTVTADFVLNSGTWRYANDVAAQLTVNGSMTVNSTVQCQRVSATGHGLGRTFTVGGDLTVGSAGIVSAMGYGFAALQGPGKPASSGGGGHGGTGGNWDNSGGTPGGSCYGSVTNPSSLGSGGEASAGGGAMRFVVAGTVTVDGVMAADGAPLPSGNRGTGAGGSVFISAHSISGTGMIRAQGGYVNAAVLHYAPGGGGRVALHYSDSLTFPLTNVSVRSHTSYSYGKAGAAGTIYIQGPSGSGTLIVDNENIATAAGTFPKPTTLFSNLVTDLPSGNVLIRNLADLQLTPSINLAVGGYWTNNGTFTCSDSSRVTFWSSSPASIAGNSSFYDLTCTNAGKQLTFEAGKTNTVRNLLVLKGETGTPLTLRSSNPGSRWMLRVLSGSAPHQIRLVDVSYSHANGTGIAAYESVDSGNNINWIFAQDGQTNTWTGTVNGTWTNGNNWSLSRSTVPSDVAIIAASTNIPTLDFEKRVLNLKIQPGASLRLGGYNLGVTDLAVQGYLVATGAEQIAIDGNVDLTGGVFSNAASTVKLVGIATQTVTSGSASFRRLELAGSSSIHFMDAVRATNLHVYGGSAAFDGGMTCSAALTNQAGSLVFGGPVQCSWFISSAGPLQFNGTVQAGVFRNIGANAVFGANLTAGEFRTEATNTLTFHAGSDYTISNLWLHGQSGAPLLLRSSAPGAAWKLNVLRAFGVTYADAADSDASGGLTIRPIMTANSGNNVNWDFTKSMGWQKWTGSSSVNFTNAANWSPAVVPGPTSDIFIDGTFVNAPRLTNTLSVANLTIGGYSNVSLTVDSPLTVLGDLVVMPKGTITHSANSTTNIYAVNVLVNGNLTVDGEINAVDKGFAASYGPGKTLGNQSGGGHGGVGGSWTHVSSTGPGGGCYGSISQPTALGSGGNGGRGGGAIRLTVGGRTSVGGLITASALDLPASTGAGAGGSVWITTGTFDGFGRIESNGGRGGNYNGFGYAHGGGGRVSVCLTNSASFGNVLYSVATPLGASAGTAGGAGTVYLKSALASYGTILVDNQMATTALTTDISSNVTDAAAGDLIVRNNAQLQILTNQTLTVYGDLINSATVTSLWNGTLILAGTNAATVNGALILHHVQAITPGKTIRFTPAKTLRVDGTLMLKDVNLASTQPGTRWTLTATQPVVTGNVARVTVQDCNASAGQKIVARSSTDAGNNLNWQFIRGVGTLFFVR